MKTHFRDVKLVVGVIAVILSIVISETVAQTDDRHMHPDLPADDVTSRFVARADIREQEQDFWRAKAQKFLSEKILTEKTPNTNRAKNVILFLGDGMSLPTVAATRVYIGGEEKQLSFEKFPHFGLSKTYCVDRQVADSATTATAYLSGVKGNYGTAGVNAQVPRYDCDADQVKSNQAPSIAKWAMDNCKAAGLVTTSRVTHASPSGVYAHTANRDWENDADVKRHKCDPKKTIDIARQLIESDVGKNLKVVMGGGRREFRDSKIVDEEGTIGSRTDGLDLIDQWQREHSKLGNASFIWNKKALMELDYQKTDYLMGLFESDHCLFHGEIKDNLTETEPTLSEMAVAAVKLLQNEKNGFFLFVESARIDMAHHENWARRALDETAEFSRTIDLVRQMTNESDTLIIVTADHAHVMTYNGYPLRGNNILGLSGRIGSDGLPYSTLSYANGLGFYNTYNEKGDRKDVSKLDYTDPALRYMAMVPADSETHGGDDVGVYASGPWSHLFTGTYEQNNIPVLMSYAAKIGLYSEGERKCSGATSLQVSVTVLTVIFAAALKCWFQ